MGRPAVAKRSTKISHSTVSSCESVPLKSNAIARAATSTSLGSPMAIDAVLERLWPGRRVTVERLGGGLTNHNFKVTVDGEAFVVRVAGKDTELLGIDRRTHPGAAPVARQIGAGPEVPPFVRPAGRPRDAF